MISEFLKVLIPLFVVLDPFATVPVFVSLVGNKPPAVRNKFSRDATVAALVILLGFGLLGNLILDFLGVTIESFLVAGALLLLFVAFDLFSDEPRLRRAISQAAFVPVATPLLAGPGAITTVMISIRAFGFFDTMAATVVALLISKLVIDSSSWFTRIVGHNGLKILTRINGLLIAAIAIEFMRKALLAWGIVK